MTVFILSICLGTVYVVLCFFREIEKINKTTKEILECLQGKAGKSGGEKCPSPHRGDGHR